MLKLKEIRKFRNKTQDDVADFLKIQRSSYANIENGRRDPDTQTLMRLAYYFDVSMDMIFGLKTEGNVQRHTETLLTDDERQLVSFYRVLNRENKKAILTTIESMAGNPASQEEKSSAKRA